MKIQRAYRTELYPTDDQVRHFVKACGISRFAYNWALERKETAFREHSLNRSILSLKNELNRRKPKEFPWMYEASKCVPEEALWDLDKAYRNLFRHLRGDKESGLTTPTVCKECKAPRFGPHIGRPAFKTKRRGLGSFRIEGHRVRVYADCVQIPLLGVVRLKERGYVPWEDISILSATVSERAGRWFVSINVVQNIAVPTNNGPEAGMDLGVSALATLSDRTAFENPKGLTRHERRLKRLQRSVSRKQKGSNNRGKAVHRLARAHRRIANIRRDALHKMTTKLAKNYSIIGMEALNVKGLMRSGFAKGIQDASLGEVRRQLGYKTRWFGSRIVIADRFHPSSQLCSNCGGRKQMPLHARVYHCPSCGFVDDRDHNAAVNLEPRRLVAVGSPETLNACLSREVQAAGSVPDHDAGIIVDFK